MRRRRFNCEIQLFIGGTIITNCLSVVQLNFIVLLHPLLRKYTLYLHSYLSTCTKSLLSARFLLSSFPPFHCHWTFVRCRAEPPLTLVATCSRSFFIIQFFIRRVFRTTIIFNFNAAPSMGFNLLLFGEVTSQPLALTIRINSNRICDLLLLQLGGRELSRWDDCCQVVKVNSHLLF